MDYLIKNVKYINGETTVPGDKSISHRALMFGAIAQGRTEIKGLSGCEDVKRTMNCLRLLGVDITEDEDIVAVNGKGLKGLAAPTEILDAGNSGTTIRLLSGILAGQNFSATITGDDSLQKRPMKRIIEPLRKINADIAGADDNYAPLTINSSQLMNFDHTLSVASAQVKSCLLLAGLNARGTTTITEPERSRDHTERMLSYLGAKIEVKNHTVSIEGSFQLKAAPIVVPGDISAAAFFIIAASILKNSKVLVKNVGVNPSRNGILDILRCMGGIYVEKNQQIHNNEHFADIIVQSAQLEGITIGEKIIPRSIDEIPILAVAATQANGETVITNAAELRVKETDRIRTVVDNLQRMGVQVRELPDGMIIDGNQTLKGAEIDSAGDHRIAMAFAIAGLMAQGETVIKNAECADVSHPGFYQQLQDLCYD